MAGTIKGAYGDIFFAEGYDQPIEKVTTQGAINAVLNKISDITRSNETAEVPNCATGESVKYATKSKVDDITVEYTLTDASDITFMESATEDRKNLTAVIKSSIGTTRKFNCIVASNTGTGADADAPMKYTIKLAVSGKIISSKTK